MLNERGGIRCDLTVTRLGSDRFLVVTGGGTGPLDLHWMRRNLPGDGSVALADISSSLCCIGLWGPRARDLLERVTTSGVANRDFRYMSAKQIDVEEVPVLAIRISYVGELGWELYAPTEFGSRLWDILWEAGQPLGLAAAGGGAFDSLRLEKGYRLWGNDIHTEYSPLEAGIEFAVRLDKGEFIGRSGADPGPGRGGHPEAIVPRARRSVARGDGQGADPGRRGAHRLRDQRQLRLHRGEEHRLRVPAGRAGRDGEQT